MNFDMFEPPALAANEVYIGIDTPAVAFFFEVVLVDIDQCTNSDQPFDHCFLGRLEKTQSY